MNKQSKVKLYAKALAEIISSSKKFSAFDKTRIANNFVKLLINAGYEKRLKEILDLTQDFILTKTGKRKITLETARKITLRQKKMLESFIKEGDVVKEKVNPELIAGVKIIINDSWQFDASLQKQLQELFSNF